MTEYFSLQKFVPVIERQAPPQILPLAPKQVALATSDKCFLFCPLFVKSLLLGDLTLEFLKYV